MGLKLNVDNARNFDIALFRGSYFDDFLAHCPEFVYHIFAIYNKSLNKWYPLNEIALTDKCCLKIIPSALFTDEKTLKFVIEFLSSDIRLLRLFICVLVEEYDASYIVGLLPNLIVLYQLLIDDHCCDAAIERLNWIFRRKRKMVHIQYFSKIRAQVLDTVQHSLRVANPDIVVGRLAQQIVINKFFQRHYGQFQRLSLSIGQCKIDNEMFNWSDLLCLSVEDSGDDVPFAIKFVFDTLFGESSLSFTMHSRAEAEMTHFVLAAQMDLLKSLHCRRSVAPQCGPFLLPSSCLRQHWQLERLLANPHRRQISFLRHADFNRDDHMPQYIGSSYEIKFTPLILGNRQQVDHVCIKTLKDCDKVEQFWQMWTTYIDWHHPNILQCYGLLRFSCGFFRELSTGPLIFSVFKNEAEFRYRDVMSILLGIGSALEYLRVCFQQFHGNINLKTIFKVGDVYKLSEPSLSETNSDNYFRHTSLFDPGVQYNSNDQFSRDLWGLLLSIIFIYFMNEKSYNSQITKESFEKTRCNEQLRTLLLNCINARKAVNSLLIELEEHFIKLNDSELNSIIVSKNNTWIPEFLKTITRDAKMFEFNEINFNEITLGKLIGHGNYGEVHEAIYSHSGTETKVAVKMIKKQQVDLSVMKNELRPSTFERHENVLRSFGYSIYKNRTYLISELGHSNLQSYLTNRNPLPENLCQKFCIQICEGMEFLSDEKKFIHRDLAARNIIVFRVDDDEDNVVLKISDFGLALALKEDKDYYKSKSEGHKLWLHPDDLKSGKFSTKTDIYSFGVLMWEIFTGKDVTKVLPQLGICDWAYAIMTECWKKEEDRPENFRTLKQLIINK